MTRSRRAGLSRDEVRQQPLYARMLGLQYLAPSGFLCFVFLEGAIALGILLALAELVSWWGVLVLPVTVAIMVKLNDAVAGALTRPQVRPAGAGSRSGPDLGARVPGSRGSDFEPHTRGAETVRLPESLIAKVNGTPPLRSAAAAEQSPHPETAAPPEREPVDGPWAPRPAERWTPGTPGRFAPASASHVTRVGTDRFLPDSATPFGPDEAAAAFTQDGGDRIGRGDSGPFAPEGAGPSTSGGGGSFSSGGGGSFSSGGGGSFSSGSAGSFASGSAGSFASGSAGSFASDGAGPFIPDSAGPVVRDDAEPFARDGDDRFGHEGWNRWTARDGEQRLPAGPPIGAGAFAADAEAGGGAGGPLSAPDADGGEPGMLHGPRTVQQWASHVDDQQQRARQSAARRYE